jgi:hypothetical protein
LKEDMTKFQFGHAIAGRHEPSSDMASSSDGLFKLLNIVDDCCKVGAEDGVGGTDAEAGPLTLARWLVLIVSTDAKQNHHPHVIMS